MIFRAVLVSWLIWITTLILFLLAIKMIYAFLNTDGLINFSLPQPPVISDSRLTPPDISLFNEPDAWTPYRVDEMSSDDEAIFFAPESRLPLKVSGIVVQSDQSRNLAVIDAGASQFTVGINENLHEYSLHVVRIFSDRIIISYQGNYQSIIMKQDGDFMPKEL